MNPSHRHRLLEDVLLPSTLTDSLAATRRAARHRRIRRRAVRTAAAACFILAGAWILRLPPETTGTGTTHQTGNQKVPPPFVLVTTGPPQNSVVRHTPKAPDHLTVTTRNAAGSTPRASKDDLFTLAGSRPAGLHQLPDGTARWMWIDQLELR